MERDRGTHTQGPRPRPWSLQCREEADQIRDAPGWYHEALHRRLRGQGGATWGSQGGGRASAWLLASPGDSSSFPNDPLPQASFLLPSSLRSGEVWEMRWFPGTDQVPHGTLHRVHIWRTFPPSPSRATLLRLSFLLPYSCPGEETRQRLCLNIMTMNQSSTPPASAPLHLLLPFIFPLWLCALPRAPLPAPLALSSADPNPPLLPPALRVALPARLLLPSRPGAECRRGLLRAAQPLWLPGPAERGAAPARGSAAQA